MYPVTVLLSVLGHYSWTTVSVVFCVLIYVGNKLSLSLSLSLFRLRHEQSGGVRVVYARRVGERGQPESIGLRLADTELLQ